MTRRRNLVALTLVMMRAIGAAGAFVLNGYFIFAPVRDSRSNCGPGAGRGRLSPQCRLRLRKRRGLRHQLLRQLSRQRHRLGHLLTQLSFLNVGSNVAFRDGRNLGARSSARQTCAQTSRVYSGRLVCHRAGDRELLGELVEFSESNPYLSPAGLLVA